MSNEQKNPEKRDGLLLLEPIARIKTDFSQKFGVPRQSGRVKELKGTVVFEKKYAVPEALRGIEDYSHLWLLWGFSLCLKNDSSPTVRPPRLGGNIRMGVFATRSPNRPNPIGLSLVRLFEVKKTPSGPLLLVGGADLVDGTPIYDIKPYLPLADSAPDARGGFADKFADYHVEVDIPDRLLSILPEDKRAALAGILREDPRPSYQNDSRTYGLSFAGYNISFFADAEGVLHVTEIIKDEHRKP